MRRRLQTTNDRSLPLVGLRRLAATLCCLVLGVALALVPATAALAEDASLTLQLEYTAKGKTTPIDGATMTVYQVASINDGINNYELLDDFKALGVDFNAGMDAKTMAKVAKRAAAIAKNKKVKGTEVTSDKKGTAALGTLPKGIYLVTQTGAKDTAKDYKTLDAFLVSVPQLTEEGIEWNVVARPKPTPQAAKKPATPAKKTEKLAKTSDLLDPRLVALCLGIGAALVVTGFMSRRRKDEK